MSVVCFVTAVGCHSAFAQGRNKVGFFTLVNAVALPSNTVVAVDNRVLRPQGFAPGMATGGLGLQAGPHTITAANADCKAASLNLQLDANGSPIVIAYLQETHVSDGRIIRELKLFARGNQPSAATKVFSALYAGKNQSVSVSFNGQPQSLQPLREVRIAASGPAIRVTRNNQSVAAFNPEESGNYIIVFYDTLDGNIGAVLVQDVIRHAAG